MIAYIAEYDASTIKRNKLIVKVGYIIVNIVTALFTYGLAKLGL
jgi:hypothetical protein